MTTLIFFHGYVWTLILAGAIGVFTATADHRLLFHLRVESLAPATAASLVSQYRFLRAIEGGFGLFAFVFRKEIFQSRRFNRLFLGTMFFGVGARLISYLLDGWPLPLFHAFMISEVIGGTLIYFYTRNQLKAP